MQTYTTGNPVVASVQVTDNGGALVTDSVTIKVHGWAAPRTIDSNGNVGYYTSLAVVDGNPAISNCDYSSKDLKFVGMY